jgi:ligand-binding sensor domain-containing protein
VGTFGGLARFDGIKFTIFNSGNTTGLTSNRILSLYEDRAGTPWIGAETGEVMQLATGRARTHNRGWLPGGLVWTVMKTRQERGIGTSRGLAHYEDGTVKNSHTARRTGG